MTVAPVTDLVIAARPGGLAAFNVIALEHAEAVAAAAAATGRPAVLQISQNTVRYHDGLTPIARACLAVAAAASVPMTVHLDHATSPELIREAVDLGITSVMYDGSALGYAENVERTASIAQWCQERGACVEGELGEVGGKGQREVAGTVGAHAPGARTDPVAAAAFVAATGVDTLAVAVGSEHAMHTRSARLDDELIARLAAQVPVPLVLHGSSGVADAGLRSAVRHGMSKINIATRLNMSMTQSIRDALAGDPEVSDPRRYLGPGRSAVTREAERLLRVLE